jgi:hypothetical protein
MDIRHFIHTNSKPTFYTKSSIVAKQNYPCSNPSTLAQVWVLQHAPGTET